MTSERSEFEKWAAPILAGNPNWRESGDCELAWQSWQARAALATQAVTIKLPDRKRYNGLGPSAENLASAAWNQCLDAVQKLNAVRGAEHE